MARLPRPERSPRLDRALAALQSTLGPSAGEVVGQLLTVARAAATAAGEAAHEARAAARAGVDVVHQARDVVQQAKVTVQQAREAVATVHRVAARADELVAELEEPLRALRPGLARLAAVLDNPVVDDVPATLRQIRDDLPPVLRTLADASGRLALVTGPTDRLLSFVDDTSRNLGLPGAGLLGRRRPPIKGAGSGAQRPAEQE